VQLFLTLFNDSVVFTVTNTHIQKLVSISFSVKSTNKQSSDNSFKKCKLVQFDNLRRTQNEDLLIRKLKIPVIVLKQKIISSIQNMARQPGILTPNFVCFALLWSQFFALSIKTETLIKENELEELKENAENVCIDQEVQNTDQPQDQA